MTFFRDKGKHVIDWIWLSDRGIYKATNITEVTTRGLEITMDYRFADNGCSSFQLNKLGASYTFINLERATGNFVSKYSLDYLKHKLCLFVIHNFTKNIHINWQVSYLSRNGTYLDYDSSTKTRFVSDFKPFWLADSKIYYEKGIIKIFADVSNLLNTKYTDIGNLIQAGRWITGGIQVNITYDNHDSGSFKNK